MKIMVTSSGNRSEFRQSGDDLNLHHSDPRTVVAATANGDNPWRLRGEARCESDQQYRMMNEHGGIMLGMSLSSAAENRRFLAEKAMGMTTARQILTPCAPVSRRNERIGIRFRAPD